MTESGPEPDHTVESDDEVVEQSADLEELIRNAGVIELPDTPWLDTGSGPGWSESDGTAWERHDAPEQQP